MKIKTFHIRLSKEHIISDENRINEFLTGKQVINTFASLVNAEKLNFWSVVVTYPSSLEHIARYNYLYYFCQKKLWQIQQI